MAKRSFSKRSEYLHIPIHDDNPENFYYVKIYDGEEQIHEFHMGVSVPKWRQFTDFYVPLYIGDYKSDTVTLVADDYDIPDELFDGVLEGGKPENEKALYPDLYHEDVRQQFHFSPKIGWMNDPNGLFYKDGIFHLYFQHNPFGSHHGAVNISWGHATSTDGVHFVEHTDAIMPRSSRCSIASGSAIVDEDNFFGKGKGAVIAAYTALQSWHYRRREPITESGGQQLLFSTDGGMTFEYFENNPIIPVPDGKAWRDPKILKLDGCYAIVVYEDIDGVNYASFYVSDNGSDWTLKSRSPDICECPDLFPLKTCETGEILWILYGGIGKYSVGYFDNFTFTPIEKDLFIDYGANAYAGQTFNNYPSDVFRYHISWLLDHKQHCGFNKNSIITGKSISQAMSLVCKLELHKTDRGYRLFRTPIETVNSLRLSEDSTVLSDDMHIDSLSEYSFSISDTKVSITLDGQGFCLEGGKITSTSGKEYILRGGKIHDVRMFVDKRSVEFFVDGEISLSFFVPEEKQILSLSGIEEIKAKRYLLSSIW